MNKAIAVGTINSTSIWTIWTTKGNAMQRTEMKVVLSFQRLVHFRWVLDMHFQCSAIFRGGLLSLQQSFAIYIPFLRSFEVKMFIPFDFIHCVRIVFIFKVKVIQFYQTIRKFLSDLNLQVIFMYFVIIIWTILSLTAIWPFSTTTFEHTQFYSILN